MPSAIAPFSFRVKEVEGKTYAFEVRGVPQGAKTTVFVDKKGKSWFHVKIYVQSVGRKGEWRDIYGTERWRVKPFLSYRTYGLCYWKVSCVDVRQLRKSFVGNGDVLGLKKKVIARK